MSHGYFCLATVINTTCTACEIFSFWSESMEQRGYVPLRSQAEWCHYSYLRSLGKERTVFILFNLRIFFACSEYHIKLFSILTNNISILLKAILLSQGFNAFNDYMSLSSMFYTSGSILVSQLILYEKLFISTAVTLTFTF